jgi:AcrR family transcriptional regulator
MTKILQARESAPKSSVPPRERILLAARDLFYARGIRAVSVDDIAEAAQTNKMTLYRHFDSKDLLIAEYVKLLSAEADMVWHELQAKHPDDPFAQLRAWIEETGELMARSGARGCAIANAAVEIPDKVHPARAVIEQHKTHQRENVARLCRQSGFDDPERLADELFLILEGAHINVQSVGQCGPGSRFAGMACALISTSPRNGH